MTTAYIVSNPLSGATRSKAIYRVAGTVIGAAAAVAMVPALVDWPMLLSLAMAVWVGGCLAISLLDRSPRSYVVMLAGYTCAIIAFPSVDAPGGVFDIAVARVTEIVLGIVCATLVNSLILPRPVSSVLGPRLHKWLGDAEHWLAETLEGDASHFDSHRHQLAVDAVDCALLASHIPYDTSHWREATKVVRALLERMLLLLPLLSGLADRRAALGAGGEAEVHEARQWLAAGCPADALPTLDMQGIGASPAQDWHGLLATSFRVRLSQTIGTMAECRQVLAHLDDPHTPLPAEWRVASLSSAKMHSDVMLAGLSGLSAAIAVLLCCALWIISGWADGATAAALTAVFCSMFAALDNPVPTMLRFGGAMIAAIPLACFYVFAILPQIDGFAALALVMAPLLLLAGFFLQHPRHGLPALAAIVGFCSALAIQENFNVSFDRFVNANIGLVVAMVLATGTTAVLRNLGADLAAARALRAARKGLMRLARASSAPTPAAALSRAIDQLAQVTLRIRASEASAGGGAGLREVRLTMNLVAILQLREQAAPRLQIALTGLLRKAGAYFAENEARGGRLAGDAGLLRYVDRVLRLALADPAPAQPSPHPFGHPLAPERPHELAALVAFRRNMFPDAPEFLTARPDAAT